MKKILVVGLISMFSAGAFAAACPSTSGATQISAGSATTPAAGEQCVCDGGVAIKNKVNGGAGTAVTTPLFIKNGFDVQCSANTLVSYNEVSASQFAVGSGSKKGNQSFKGSSSGGGIAVFGTCPSSGCTPTETSAALAQAVTDSGS